jgi:6-phosphogluconolactonase (cycloisomerase 2 family)
MKIRTPSGTLLPLFFALSLASSLSGAITLTSPMNPAAPYAGQNVQLSATGFTAAVTNVNVTITPPAGSGNAVTFAAATVAPSTGSTRRIVFTVPSSLSTPVALPNTSISVSGLAAGVAFTTNTIQFTLAAPPSVSNISPGAGQTGTAVNGVLITLKNTGWSPATLGDVHVSLAGQASTTVTGTVTAFNTLSSGTQQVTANFVIPANAPTGTYDVRASFIAGAPYTLTAGFAVTNTPGLAISLIAPNLGTQGAASLQVAVTGVGTTFTQALTTANFGDGVQILSTTVASRTQATFTLRIDPLAPTGLRNVTVVTGGEFAMAQGGFTIVSSAATISPVTPATGSQGTNLTVRLTGNGTHWVPSGTNVSFGTGINVGNVAVNQAAQTIDVAITVAPDAAPGPRSVTATTNGEIAGSVNGFTVTTAAFPSITSISPTVGAQGTSLSVTVNTANTSFTAGSAPTFDFGPNISVDSVIVNGPAGVTANISIQNVAIIGTRTVILSNNGINLSFVFTVQPNAAAITIVTPPTGLLGSSVALTVAGSGTHWVQGTTTASLGLGITVNRVVVNGSGSAEVDITIAANAPLGAHGLNLSTGGETATYQAGFTVTGCTPSLSMNAASGMVGNTVQVNFAGKCTAWSPGQSFPVIDGQGVTIQNFQVSSATSASATFVISPTAPASPQFICPNRNLTVTTPLAGGSQVVTAPYCVTSTPAVLTGITPFHAAPNTGPLDVAITGAFTHFDATTTVTFGANITVAAGAVTVTDATHLVAHIQSISAAAVPGWRQAFVNTTSANEQLTTGLLIDDSTASATLTSVGPASGAQGQTLTVTITGNLTNFTSTGANPTLAIFGQGVTVQNLNIINNTTASAVLQIAATTPTGLRTVDMISGAEVVSGPLFSVTNGIATISSISVSSGVVGTDPTVSYPPSVPVNQGAVLNFLLTGANSHFLQGGTTLNFGSGITVNQFTVVDPLTITGQMTVGYSAASGLRGVSAYTLGESAPSSSDLLLVNLSQSSSVNVTPTSGQQGTTLNLQVNGIGTRWVNGLTTASLGNNNGLTVNSFTVNNVSQQAVLNLTITGTTYVPGPYTLTITTNHSAGDIEIQTLNNVFSVAQGAAIITNVSPNSSAQGTTLNVSITGQNTNFRNGVTTAAFTPGGCPSINNTDVNVANVAAMDATHATLSVAVSTTAGTGLRSLCITTLGEFANFGNAFTVTPGIPTLNGVSPVSAQQGQTLTLNLLGQYTRWTQGVTTATFGQGITLQSLTVADNTHATAQISIDPLAYTGGRTVNVTTNTEVVSGGYFSVTPSAAILTSLSPTTANQGTQNLLMQINGNGTHWAQGQTQFQITGGNYDITINGFQVTSATSAIADLTLSPTAALGTRTIYLSTGGENLSLGNSFVVTGGIPAITCVSPSTITQGTTNANIQLCGAYTQWTSGGATPTQVTFDAAAFTTSQILIDSSTAITAVVNVLATATTGLHTIQIRTGNQVLSTNINVVSAAVPPTPYISYQNPGSALVGQTLDVYFSGSSTNWLPGSTSILFGAGITINTFQVTGLTSAVANISIDPNAATGARTVRITTGSQVLTSSFSVVVGTPVISLLDPGSILQGQTRDVDLVGQFTTFNANTAFTFGPGITVNSMLIFSATAARVNLTASPIAPTGAALVTATTVTLGGIQTAFGYFSVAPGISVITSVSPNTALQGTTLTGVTVKGFSTTWIQGTTSFSFGGGITVSNVAIANSTTATMNLTLDPFAGTGIRGVTAQTGGEVATLSNAFVVQPGTPILLSSTPASARQGANFSVGILGQFTAFDATTTVSLGAGMLSVVPNVTSSNSITVTGVVDPVAFTGPRNVTVTTGTQVLTLYSAFGVTAGSAAITALSPMQGSQGQTLNVVVTGTNTHFTRATPAVSFGPGIGVNSILVTDDTHLTVNASISALSTPGLNSVTVTTLGETATGASIFTIIAATPVLSFVNPNSVPQGLTADVVVTGTFTSFLSNSTVTFGNGVTVNYPVRNVSATQFTASITVSPTAFIGNRDVTVTTGAEVVTLTNGFSVSSAQAGVNSYAYVANINDNSISAYTIINATGALVPVSGSPFATGGSPASVAVAPSGRFAYASNQAGSTISVYSLSTSTGALTPISGSPFSAGTAPHALAFSPSGAFLYVGDSTTNVVSAYALNPSTGAPTAVGSPVSVARRPVSIAIAPSGLFAYVVSTGDRNLDAFALNPNTGAITHLSGFPISAGSDPQQVVLSPDGQFAWVTDDVFNNVLSFAVNTSTGALTPVGTTPAGAVAYPITTTPSGRFVYAGSVGNNTLAGFSVNPSTGGLTAVPGSPFSLTAPNVPYGAAVNPTGQFVYTANAENSNNVSAFSIDQTTGSLTPVPGSPFAAGNLPRSIAIALPGTALTGVFPNSGPQNNTAFPIVITGNGTHFDITSSLNPGSGITVNSLNAVSPTYLTAILNISSGATLGTRNITVSTGGEILTLTNAFTVAARTPALTSVSPASAHQADTALPVTISGVFTHFTAGSNVSFGAGVTATVVSAPNATTLNVTITVDPAATVGPRTITVTSGTETATLTNTFQVTGGIPILTLVTPNHGRRGTANLALSVFGNYTAFDATTTAAFSGTGITGTVTPVSATQATLLINIDPAAALTTRSLTLTTGGVPASLAAAFLVDPAAFNLQSSTLPTGIVGTPYSQTVTPTGGVGPFNNLQVSGAPAWMTVSLVSNTGTITFGGTPTTAGTVNLAVQLSDSSAQTASATFTLTVAPPLIVVPSTLPSGVVGVPYSQQVSANGGTAPVTLLLTGTLPTNLSFNTTSGLISGMPNATGTFNFSVKATDADTQTYTRNYQVVIYPALTISTTSLPAGRRTFAYNQTVAFSGGVPPITASISSGQLPANLALNPSTGAITGPPTAAGTSNFQVTVTDANNNTVSQNLSILVNDILSITSTSPLPGGIVGQNYSQSIATANGVAPVTFAVTGGALPNSVTLAPATGLLSGSPSVADTFNFTIQATDNLNVTASQSFAITILPPPLVTGLTPNQLAQGQSGNIVVAAQDTHFVNGTTTANFGAGVTVNSVTVTSPTAATVAVTINANAAAGPRNVQLVTGTETAPLTNGFTVLAGLPTISTLSPAYGKKSTTVSVTVTGQNLLGATFQFQSPIPNDNTVPGTISITSNDGTTAVLGIALGATTGQYAILGNTAVGSSMANAAAQFVVTPSTLSAVSRSAVVLNTYNNWSNTIALPAGQNTAISRYVSVLNIYNNWNNTIALPTGQNTATSRAASVLNIFNNWNNTIALPTGQNTATSRAASVLNIFNNWNSTIALPTGQNTATSRAASVLNIFNNWPNFGTLPVGQNTPLTRPVAVCNRPSGCPASAAHTVELPVSSSQTGLSTTGALIARIESIESLETVTEGRTLNLKVGQVSQEGAAPVQVSWEVNGVLIASSSEAPYEQLFTVPTGIRDLTFRALIRHASGTEISTAYVHVRVVPDPGATIQTPPLSANETLTLAAGGLKAEYFEFTTPLTAAPDLADATPKRTDYVTAINQPNPAGIFGNDPLGAGVAKDFAARYSGEIWMERDGHYRFWLTARSGAQLKLDDKLLGATAFSTGSPTETLLETDLTRGWHNITAEYYLAVGVESLRLEWQQPAGTRSVIGPDYLRTSLTGAAHTVPTKFDSIWIRIKEGSTVREIPVRLPQTIEKVKESNQ